MEIITKEITRKDGFVVPSIEVFINEAETTELIEMLEKIKTGSDSVGRGYGNCSISFTRQGV